jgi:methyltransferase (TIGR00027 family)
VVILAAGLDTRAFRLTWPAGVRLFELDTPEVLTFKEQVLAERDATLACQRVAISTDLRQDWPAAVVQAGFHSGEPTAWLAEGLLMYLTQDECDQLLDRIGQLSAPGSRLAIEYVDQATIQLMRDALDESPYSAFLKTCGNQVDRIPPAGLAATDGRLKSTPPPSAPSPTADHCRIPPVQWRKQYGQQKAD